MILDKAVKWGGFGCVPAVDGALSKGSLLRAFLGSLSVVVIGETLGVPTFQNVSGGGYQTKKRGFDS
ncbi:MAG: hypothetical protein CMF26_06965 [Kiloniella sp.]|nr:hypothetical protein [Kiloniella sp.]